MTTKTKQLPAKESLFETTEPPMSTALVEHEVTPLDQLASLIANGGTADQLSQFVDLYERMGDRQAKQIFAKAMHDAQVEMPVVVKDATNPHTQSKFALLETVKKIAKPIYTKHGFSMNYGEADCPLPGRKRTICDVTHATGHTRSYHIDLPIDGMGSQGRANAMNAVQGEISTTSYAERRLCCMVWDMTIAGEDDDGAGATRKITEDQYAELEDLLNETDTNRAKFLAWAGVEKLGEMPANKYNDAVIFLKKKLAR